MKLLCVLGLLSLYFASEQTTTAQEVTTAAPEDNLYFVKSNGVVCILLSVNMGFNFTYLTNANKNESIAYSLPASNSVTVTGSCDANNQYISLKWKPGTAATEFTARMNFVESNQQQYVSDIILDYVVTDELFPNANVTGAQKANTSGEFFKVSDSNQYLCKSNSTLKISNNVGMLTYEMNLQAFRKTNTTAFTGDRQQCPADAETNNIVPIAVGAALAALVVIVLCAYLISRNRNKGGYESV